MRVRTWTVLCTLMAVILAAASSSAQSYQLHLTCRATIAVPSASEGSPTVYVRNSDGDWAPAEFDVRDGQVVVMLDPAALGGGQAMVLIDPPAGMDIEDAGPPALASLSVDRAPLKPSTEAQLGVSATWPRRLVFAVTDAENALDPGSVRVIVDGERLTRRVRVEPFPELAPNALWVRAKLPRTDYGEHVITYSVADGSPQRNRLEGRIDFSRYDMTNFVLAARGTTLDADSYFQSYPSLACLQDGDTNLPGNTLPNSISWASSETPSPHWVEVDFGQVRRIKEVTVYWANYSDRLNTSNTVEVQIPDGDDWKAVYRSPEEGEKPATCTTREFAPVDVRRFRLWQPAGAGGDLRPDLMWLAEIEAR